MPRPFDKVNPVNRSIRRLCVFCGSSPGNDPVYADAATALGRILAEREISMVYPFREAADRILNERMLFTSRLQRLESGTRHRFGENRD